MAEKKKKKKVDKRPATRRVFDSILGTPDRERDDFKFDAMSKAVTDTVDSGLKKVGLERIGDKPKARNDYGRLDEGARAKVFKRITKSGAARQVSGLEKPKKKVRKKSSLTKPSKPPAKKPSRESTNDNSPMSLTQIGAHNAKSLNELHGGLSGKSKPGSNRPDLIDQNGKQFIMGEKPFIGPAEAPFDGSAEDIIPQAAANAGIDDTEPGWFDRISEFFIGKDDDEIINEGEKIKEKKPEKDWTDDDRFVVALGALIAPLVGYALGGYEGALAGAKADADGAKVYYGMKREDEVAAAKAKITPKNKSMTILVDDPNTGEKISVFGKIGAGGYPEPYLDQNGKHIKSTEFQKVRLINEAKLREKKITTEGDVAKAKEKTLQDSNKEKSRQAREDKRSEDMMARLLASQKASEKRTTAQINASNKRFQAAIDSREKIARNKADALIKRNIASGANLPIDKRKMVETMSRKIGTKLLIADQLHAGLEGFSRWLRAGNEAQAVAEGQGLSKVLNSTEGADAVGVEESRKLEHFLKFKILNLTGAGSVWGRDLKEFEMQLRSKIVQVRRAASVSQSTVDKILRGEKLPVQRKVGSIKHKKPASKKNSARVMKIKKEIKGDSNGVFPSGGKKYKIIKIENGYTYYQEVK